MTTHGKYIHFASPRSRRSLDLNTVMVSPSSPGGVFPGSLPPSDGRPRSSSGEFRAAPRSSFYTSEPFPVPPAVAPPSGFWAGASGDRFLQREFDGTPLLNPPWGPTGRVNPFPGAKPPGPPARPREGFSYSSPRGVSASFASIRRGEKSPACGTYTGRPVAAPSDQAQKWMPRDTSTAYLVGLEREDWSSGVEAPHPPHFSRYSRPRGWFGGVVDGVWPAGNVKVEDGCLPQRQPRDMAPPEMYLPDGSVRPLYLAGNASQMMKLTDEGIALAPRMSFGVVVDKACGAPLPAQGVTSRCCPEV